MRQILATLFLVIGLCQCYDWGRVESVVQKYRSSGAFAGGILRVSNSSDTIYNLPFGFLSHNDLPFSSPFVSNATIFDMASVTKVTATLSCIMRLVDLKQVSVVDLVTKFIPEYGNKGKEGTTVKNLLLHNAGLQPDYPGSLPRTKQEVMEWTYHCNLSYPIGTKFVYSDLSFILLGEIVERVTGQKLETYAKQLMQEMDMPNTTYLPDLARERFRIAPTEYSVFRKGLIRGQVHDPTAYLFGGVAGHAGFFSVVEDMEKYMQVHLNQGLNRKGQRVFTPETVQLFWTREDGLPYENRRALGWDTVPIQTNPPCGHYFSERSFGHTGYTGTSIWADRDKDLIVVLLSHRVHPTSLNSLHIEARSMITDAIVETLGLN